MAQTDVTKALTADHAALDDTLVARRYFAKFGRITGHLAQVAVEMEAEGKLSRAELRIVGDYVGALARSFTALGHKYLMTGRIEGAAPGPLTIDRHESGFPVFQELLVMANDAQQAARHLAALPSEAELKDDMIRQIVGQLAIPTQLQYVLSQRLYYEALAAGGLFWARNDPDYLWLADTGPGRRRYLLHWAVYDAQVNLPVIYLMEVEDSGRDALPKDRRRWPRAQSALMAQSLDGLKLVTIAQGFDRDFDDLHPKHLRRIHLGPMYSHAFTLQSGPLREVLEQAAGSEGEDWALAWTVEDLASARVEQEKSGWFSSVEREVFTLDPFSAQGAETGASRTERAIILPERPFQVLAEKNPEGFHAVRKFVVGSGGKVLSYR